MTKEDLLVDIHMAGDEYYSEEHSPGGVSCYEYLAGRLYGLGYRKGRGRPPLLDDEAFVDYEVEYCKAHGGLHFPLVGEARDKCNREAQRDADVKHYEGGG